MGKTNMGNLVGVGCQIDLRFDFVISVSRLYGPMAGYRRQPKGGEGSGCVGLGRCCQCTHHQIFSGLVEYATSTGQRPADGWARHPPKYAMAIIDYGFGL